MSYLQIGTLELLVSTGKFDGETARGCQGQGYIASMKRRAELSCRDKNSIQNTKDRELRGSMIGVDVGRHDK